MTGERDTAWTEAAQARQERDTARVQAQAQEAARVEANQKAAACSCALTYPGAAGPCLPVRTGGAH